MIITFRDYIMEADKEGGFHLRKKVIATSKETGEKYETEDTIGYNMRLESCIKKIIHLNHCTKEETMSLKEYIKEYKEELNRIEQMLK